LSQQTAKAKLQSKLIWVKETVNVQQWTVNRELVNLVALQGPEIQILQSLLLDPLHHDLRIVPPVQTVQYCQELHDHQSLHARQPVLSDQHVHNLLDFQHLQAGRELQLLQLHLELHHMEITGKPGSTAVLKLTSQS